MTFLHFIAPNGFENISETLRYPDSLTLADVGQKQVHMVNESAPETFLQSAATSPVEILPVLKTPLQFEWMMYALLLLIVIVVVLWFVIPNRDKAIRFFSQSFKKQGLLVQETPGLLFLVLFYLNYLAVLVFFITLLVSQYIRFDVAGATFEQITLLFSIAFVALSLFKLAAIGFSGFLFNTRNLAKQQLRLYINLDAFTGFVLLHVLLLYVSTQWDYFIYFGVIFILIINIFKWFQTARIGKSSLLFKLYHLIIYLCTLEIIPVLLLLKLIEKLNDGEIFRII